MSAKVITSKRHPVPPKIKNFSEIAMDTREGVNPYKYVASVDDDNRQSKKVVTHLQIHLMWWNCLENQMVSFN